MTFDQGQNAEFLVFDPVGPAESIDEGGIGVRPHPHIDLGTVTYLYDSEFEHCDSIGAHQMIYSGEVKWMTAGKDVTNSERTSEETRAFQQISRSTGVKRADQSM